MLMEMARVHLKAALAQPGCPFCRLRARWESDHLRTLLADYVTDGTTRLGLVRSRGYCPQHAWALQAAAQRQWQDGLKIAILYQSVGLAVHRELAAYLARPRAPERQPQPDARREASGSWRAWWAHGSRRMRSWAQRWLPRPAAEGLWARLGPSSPCPVCETLEQREQVTLRSFLLALADPEWLGLFRTSDGLCLTHLRRALASTPQPEDVQLLVEVAEQQLARLLGDLEQYRDKHRWADHPELRQPWEEAAWIRIVAFCAGEGCAEESSQVLLERQRALQAYHARPAPSPTSEGATSARQPYVGGEHS